MSEAKNISKNSKSSFYYAFNLLPAAKRDAMNTVYAFCRKTDDIVDEDVMSQEMKSQTLTKWRSEFENALKGDSEYSLLNTLGTTIAQFNIPLDPFFNLIKGMEMDLNYNRYENFEDLRLYCFRVASTVGLMCIEIFGYKHKSAKDFAENLGIALQLTNILRDIKKDALKNRIYLPREDLRRFNYSEEELLTSVYNNNFVSLMRFEVERANIYFDKATRLLHMDDKVSMFAARAMQHIYHRLLDRIVENNYDIFSNHVKVSKFEKVGIALGVWVKYNLVYQ
ncbi:MAG: presqualene diphosphate synthase HpnD [Ignavibacteriales bacterium]|nr:presqualene diphosphate synthase HpnD [Ignavibacteriaceae bacterium]NLH61112.1 presqualene diphosphate synthase HpnD [Ignavibacteriales bacterium]HOJ17583.1 presqualene diphosphate synthase HpnD [Ignavibacteriaceae bacterium]